MVGEDSKKQRTVKIQRGEIVECRKLADRRSPSAIGFNRLLGARRIPYEFPQLTPYRGSTIGGAAAEQFAEGRGQHLYIRQPVLITG